MIIFRLIILLVGTRRANLMQEALYVFTYLFGAEPPGILNRFDIQHFQALHP